MALSRCGARLSAFVRDACNVPLSGAASVADWIRECGGRAWGLGVYAYGVGHDGRHAGACLVGLVTDSHRTQCVEERKVSQIFARAFLASFANSA